MRRWCLQSTNANLALLNGVVYTGLPGAQPAQALAVRGKHILAVGSSTEVLDYCGGDTRMIDLEGAPVLPGFVDAHTHLVAWSLSRQQVDLDGAATVDAGLELVKRAAAALAPQSEVWLEGRGWDRNRWGRLPTAAELDAVVADRPAVLASHDMHSLWLNTAALRSVGISRDTRDPDGGHLERDANGEPTGVLFERAREPVFTAVPGKRPADVQAAVRSGLAEAARLGIVGIHNFEDATAQRPLQALYREGALTLRVFNGIPLPDLEPAAAMGMRTGLGDDIMRIGLLKLFADGALGSLTAHVLDPYEGCEGDGYRGLATVGDEELLQAVRTATAAGIGVAAHAIGDAAVRRVLNAFEVVRAESDNWSPILRVEHAQMVHPDDVPRFARLRVQASVQPIHAVSDWRTADRHWGARARHAYAWRSLLNAGAHLAFGSDAPVERIDPLATLHAAVTRQEASGLPAGGWYPQQRLTLAEAVRAYTWGSCVAEGAGDRRGTLEAGKLADLVVLSGDPFAAEPAALLETDVQMTMVGGSVVHERWR